MIMFIIHFFLFLLCKQDNIVILQLHFQASPMYRILQWEFCSVFYLKYRFVFFGPTVKYLSQIKSIEIILNSMKKTTKSPLFLAFLILSAQIVQAQLIQVVNVNLGNSQTSSRQYLDRYLKSEQNEKGSLIKTSNLGLVDTNTKQLLPFQSQNNEQADLGSPRNRIQKVYVNVNVNGKGSIDIQTSQSQHKNQGNKKINLRTTSQSDSSRPQNVSQALTVQKKTSKIDQNERIKQGVKNEQQNQKEVVAASKEAITTKKQNIPVEKVLKVEQQSKDVHRTEGQKEHKYISKIYVEDSNGKQLKQKSSQISKQSDKKIQVKHEQKAKQQNPTVFSTVQTTISQTPQVVASAISQDTFIQKQVSQTLVSEPPAALSPSQIINVSKQPQILATQSSQTSEQSAQEKSPKHTFMTSNETLFETKADYPKVATPLVDNEKQPVSNANLTSIKPIPQIAQTTSEISQLLSEEKSAGVNPVSIQDSQSSLQSQNITPITAGGIVDAQVSKPISSSVVADSKTQSPSAQSASAAIAPIDYNKEEKVIPKIKQAENQTFIASSSAEIITPVVHTEVLDGKIESSSLPKVQQTIVHEVIDQPVTLIQENNTITTPISMIQTTVQPQVRNQIIQTISENVQKVTDQKQQTLTPKIQEQPVVTAINQPTSIQNSEIQNLTSQQAKHSQTKSEQPESGSPIATAVVLQPKQAIQKMTNETQEPVVLNKQPDQIVTTDSNNSSMIANQEQQASKVQPQFETPSETSKNQTVAQSQQQQHPILISTVPAELTNQTNPIVTQQDSNITQNDQVSNNNTYISTEAAQDLLNAENSNQTILEPVSNVLESKVSSIKQPVDYLGISECNPGCDILSQSPICYHQSCRGCFTDQQCSSIIKDGSIQGYNIEGICHLQTGKCIVKPNPIQR